MSALTGTQNAAVKIFDEVIVGEEGLMDKEDLVKAGVDLDALKKRIQVIVETEVKAPVSTPTATATPAKEKGSKKPNGNAALTGLQFKRPSFMMIQHSGGWRMCAFALGKAFWIGKGEGSVPEDKVEKLRDVIPGGFYVMYAEEMIKRFDATPNKPEDKQELSALKKEIGKQILKEYLAAPQSWDEKAAKLPEPTPTATA